MAKAAPETETGTSPVESAKSITLSAQIVSRWEAMDAAAAMWMSMWQNIALYVMPRKSYILQKQTVPNFDRETQLFDTTAVRANQILAAGIMSYCNDADSNWLSLTAPDEIEDQDGVQEYYAECSEIILQELSRSNFYPKIHEAHLDRSGFGTCAIFVDADEYGTLNFRTFDVGTFRISENHLGIVDTIFVLRKMTVRQVVEEYGINNVSEATRRLYLKQDGKSLEQEVEVIQAIYPRTDKERAKGKKDAENKVIASVHVEKGQKKLLRNAGFDEQPAFIGRWLKWQNGAYGWSPSWIAYPDAKQLNFITKQMHALAELSAFPRLLIPESMSGEVDLRAGGITYFDDASNNTPKEWATGGRFDIGTEMIKQIQQHIEDAFNVPLFQMFAQEDLQAEGKGAITATQVRAMEAEKLVMLSPAYSTLTTEILIPIIKRVYGILSRLGKMPPPPDGLIQQHKSGDRSLDYVPEPKVVFNNRMSMAVTARAVDVIDPIIQSTLAVCQVTQDMSPMDTFDLPAIARKKALVHGTDPDFIRPKDQVAAIQKQRAQAQQQQQEMMQQAHQAEMAAKLGGVRPDSPLAPALKDAAATGFSQ